MASFLEAVGDGVRAVTCGVLGDAQTSVEWIGDRVGSPQVGAETVRSLRRWVCDNPDDSVDTPEAPFTGGQCPGVQYSVSAEIVAVSPYTDEEYRRTASVSAVGPIAEINGQVLSSRSNCTPPGGGDGFREITNLRNRLIVQDANGNFYTSPLTSPESFPWGPDDCTPGDPISPNDVVELESIVIVRSDGQPDVCGDPDAPPIPPYSPVTISRDVTYVDNSQTEITEEGDFTLNAPVIIGGNIIAPITVDVGGVEVPVEFSLSTGDITLDFGGNDTPASTSDDDEEDVPAPEDEPEVEEESFIYGLIVYSNPATGEGTVTSEIAQGDAPNLLLPRTGNVWFQVPVGNRISWMGPIPVQSQNQLVLVPGGLAASGYRLFPNTGWELSVVRMGKPPCGCVSG